MQKDVDQRQHHHAPTRQSVEVVAKAEELGFVAARLVRAATTTASSKSTLTTKLSPGGSFLPSLTAPWIKVISVFVRSSQRAQRARPSSHYAGGALRAD